MHTEIQAFPIEGVGGFIGRHNHHVDRVLTFVLRSGKHLNIALSREQLEAVVSKCIELQTIEIDSGELFHELGLSTDE